jgi:hypothetical protein
MNNLGTDDEDHVYHSIKEFWEFELNPRKSKKKKKLECLDWYKIAYEYWENEANCPLSGLKTSLK